LPKRTFQFILLLTASWCVMTFTHELGHLVGGWIGGGTLRVAELRPWHLSYSIFEPDPRPLVTLWAGPLLGVVVPIVVALLARHRVMWFTADFCLLANGVYLALAWIAGDRHLDTPRLLANGAYPAAVAIYCLLTIGFGYVRFRRDCIRFFAHRSDEHV